MRIRSSFALLVLLSLTAFALAERDHDHDRDRDNDEAGWVQLGSQRVDFQSDHDVIQVGGDDGRFTKIRLVARNGDFIMEKVTVVFDDGDTFSPEVKHRFKEDSGTRVIDLPGKARVIRRVEFTYRSAEKRDPATIVLYGRRAND